MELSEFAINILVSMIAVEDIDHGFVKRYVGLKRGAFFVIGCSVYFFVMTGMNWLIRYEGILCVFYGMTLFFYGIVALKGGNTGHNTSQPDVDFNHFFGDICCIWTNGYLDR